jgi:prophage maintenance system killer protein
MLTNDQMQQLGRFTFLMRKIYKQSVKIERFLQDAEYQSQMLNLAAKISDDTNDELLDLASALSFSLGRAA